MNGIDYNFTKEELVAMSDLLKYIRFCGGEREKLLAKIVAVALNREAFKSIYKKDVKKIPN